MNINGLDSKAIAEYQFLLLRSNDEQLPMLSKMLEAEIIKRKMIQEYDEQQRLKSSNDFGLIDGFNFHDVFDKNKNKRLNQK